MSLHFAVLQALKQLFSWYLSDICLAGVGKEPQNYGSKSEESGNKTGGAKGLALWNTGSMASGLRQSYPPE